MSRKLLRQVTLARCIPYRPYKLTATQLLSRLEDEGIHVSLRTVQRDLEEMSGMGLFDLASDERSKPHGWCFERNGMSDFANIMPLSLAVALKTWNDQASQLLPSSILTELHPLVTRAGQVIQDSQSDTVRRWLECVHRSSRPFAGYPDNQRSSLIRDALWRGRKCSAEVQRVIQKRVVWLRYDLINPLGILDKAEGPVLLCTLSELDPKIYGIPFEHIRAIELTQYDATQPKGFNLQKIVRENDIQEDIHTIHYMKR